MPEAMLKTFSAVEVSAVVLLRTLRVAVVNSYAFHSVYFFVHLLFIGSNVSEMRNADLSLEGKGINIRLSGR
jgi:hypothetical protein